MLRESVFLALANHLPRLPVFDRLRYVVLRLAGLDIEGRCTVWGPLTIRPIGGARNISIGKGAFLNTGIRFGCPEAPVVIKRSAMIGPRVSFETVNHYTVRDGWGTWPDGIVVEDRAWIGAGAIICPGVTIGRGAIVAAGSVVVKDVKPHTMVGGNPAEFLMSISPAHRVPNGTEAGQP